MVPCRHLRSKGFYGFSSRSVVDWIAHQAEHRAACACLKTGHAWGPDGQIAGPEDCTPTRRCYEAASQIDPRVGLIHRLANLSRWLRG